MVVRDQQVPSAFAAFSRVNRAHGLKRPGSSSFQRNLPDALLFGFHRRLPQLADAEPSQRIRLLQRLAMLLHHQRPSRPDLPYQVMMYEATGSLLRSAPKQPIFSGQWYSRPEAYLPHLQVAWVQGRYEAMWWLAAAQLMAAFP